MSYTPAYPSRINWENEPSTVSPINDTNLNKMDYAIYQHDQALQLFDGRITALEGASYVNSFKGRTGAVTPAQDDYTIDQIKATGTAGQYVTLDSNGKLNLSTLPAYPTAGHVVVSQSGSTMTQRSKIKFMGSVSVTDDSANDQTVVNITGGGGGGSGHTILDPTGSSMNQRTNLQFTGSGVTVSDNSTDDKTVVNISSSGHTIKDGSGTAMTAQPNLQFVDAKVTNDAQGQATKIQNFVDIDWDDWQNVGDSDDTYYRVLDAPLADGTVEVDLMTKLWENGGSPSDLFTAQNISLDSSDYDFLYIKYNYATSIFSAESDIIEKGDNANLTVEYTSSTGSVVIRRTLTYVNDTTLNISDGVMSVGGGAEITNNTGCIPIIIYGIKKKVTISIDAIAKNVRARVDYSTEEREIGTWIDGSKLYEKTIDFGALPNNTTTRKNVNISNLNLVVDIGGIATKSGNAIPLPHNDPSVTSENIGVWYSSDQIAVRTATNYSSFNGYITLRYTKTT